MEPERERGGGGRREIGEKIEGLRSKRALKRRLYTLRKRPLKDLRFSLRVLFFIYTNEKFLWRPRSCPRRFLQFAIPSGRFKALSGLRILQTTHAANAERGESI